MTTYIDPTAYRLGGDPALTDPRERRMNAVTNHGFRPVRAPFMTQISENLWHGGVEAGLVLPDFIEFKLSLYPREDYALTKPLKESRTVLMYDSLDQTFEQVAELAEWVNAKRKLGQVFVHCQAGLNRSSLVVAKALLLAGEVDTGQEAIDLIRARRDAACLCNSAFEAWVRGQERA
ncbi:dual specificity protein phosphatase family protein [Herbiconiux moechotypicola]|uniref:Tyrosine specific protein phosphatases domain-containing protein n=1 Tax=Herbiconiux moechotypicola TaxID=637393 RepID=A0ABN3DG72_9MICO|nr:dual specificity protein phosphatase family protein [Herbiconiux moechotypicola]MCS5729504.1 dual specificity protein phosphatase family protein [Herbiconiux moechotypicola]